ncbi:stage II sporulation protein D [Halobacillus salinus]|uniref:Stage II sporulation protein D n=1 Tax=Halobacillus salinus TaxID=192814 RepID=A0A4Z0GVA8_9BACI|nr:stage II sporulation protein D [Halobacillus salinus]TGB01632.1 stage II sporulation protein D [Halobacillus salinus]
MKRENWIGIIAVGGLFMAILIIPTLIVVPFTGSNDMDQVRETPQEQQAELPQDLSPFTVRVLRSSGEVEKVPLETYVARVVASEMPANFEVEALKAQSLAARTYITGQLENGSPVSEKADVTDTVQHQVYKNDVELRQQWQDAYQGNMKKINEAVKATAGEIITYERKPITAAFFSTSNGFTENAEDYWENEIPYLKSVESPWDQSSPKFKDQKIISSEELQATLGVSTIAGTTLTKTQGNRVDEVHFGDKTFTGREIREAFSLSSSDFTMSQKGDHIIFTTKGYGHGVGMSQYGANGMAKDGRTYKDIVKHYYKGIEISPLSTQTALK